MEILDRKGTACHRTPTPAVSKSNLIPLCKGWSAHLNANAERICPCATQTISSPVDELLEPGAVDAAPMRCLNSPISVSNLAVTSPGDRKRILVPLASESMSEKLGLTPHPHIRPSKYSTAGLRPNSLSFSTFGPLRLSILRNSRSPIPARAQ